MPYRVEYSPETERHLLCLRARDRRIVLHAVDLHLRQEPTRETRSRKPMRPNPLAPWELRIGDLRVYYDVREEPERVVLIRAVGVKERQRILIGGDEVTL